MLIESGHKFAETMQDLTVYQYYFVLCFAVQKNQMEQEQLTQNQQHSYGDTSVRAKRTTANRDLYDI